MKKSFLFFIIGTISFLFSCKNVPGKENSDIVNNQPSQIADTAINQTFKNDWPSLTKDFMTWYTYTYKNILLSENFIGIDTNADTIAKKTFLNKLVNGNVVAFKTKIANGQSIYQLYKLNSNDASIQATIKQMASIEIEHFKLEGTQIPDFNFTDLKGKVYNKSTTKDKLVILKCWFIHCVACAKEFPALNNLVDEYKNRNDIIFISLALDTKEDLQNFLIKKEFKYAVVPKMKII